MTTDDIADTSADLRDQLTRLGHVLSGQQDKPDLFDTSKRIVAIAEEHPATRASVLGYVFSRAHRLREVTTSKPLDDDVLKFAGVIDRYLETALTLNPTAGEFHRLLDALLDLPLFSDRNSRAFVVYWLLIDKRLPYFQLADVEDIAQETWAEGISIRSDDAVFVKHLFARGLTRWQEAEHLRVMLENRDGESRNYLLGMIVHEASKRATAAQRQGSSQ